MTNLTSPNAMLEEAKEKMLDGREPESREDWATVMNFFAYNIDKEAAETCCLLLAKIFRMPLKDREIKEIVKFQLDRRGTR